MKHPRSVTGRLGRIVALGAFALTLIPSADVSARGPEWYDLPSVLMTPANAADAGFDDYGLVLGWYATPEDLILSAISTGQDEESARDDIESSGIGTMYFNSLHPISEPRDGNLVGIAIESSISQYIDEDHAVDAFDDMSVAAVEDDYEDLDNVPSLGDESSVIEFDLSPGVRGELPVNEIDVSIRVETVIARVALVGFDTDVEPEQVEAIADLLAEKVEGLVAGEDVGASEAANLSLLVPDYYDELICVCRIQYSVVDGDALPLAYRHDEYDASQELVETYDISSQFFAMLAPLTRDEAHNDPNLRIRVTAFERAADAELFVQEAPEWVEGYPDVFEASEHVEEIASYGEFGSWEHSIALGYETIGHSTGEEFEGVVVLVQDGEYVFQISLEGYEAPDLDLMESLMDDALACLDDGCAVTASVPGDLMEYFVDQAGIADDLLG